MASDECLIIGGGVIGLSIAWELSRRGARVTVVDRERIGYGTSWAGAGILPPANFETALDPVDRLRGFSHRLHPQWAATLGEATGIDTGFRRCGAIYLARSAGESAAMAAQVNYWKEYGITAESLDEAQLVQDQPQLKSIVERGGIRGAWRVPDECQLRNPTHLKALRVACANRGVRLLESCSILNLEESNGRTPSVRVLTADGCIESEFAVMAGGAWTPGLADAIGLRTGIFPVRGQMVLYRLAAPPLTRIINEGHRYLVPRLDGRLLVGSCEEEVGYHCETTPSVLASLRRWAEAFLPDLASADVEKTWAGLRPGTVDEFPYIGRVPGRKRTFIAAGHFRSGIHLSCGTAVVVADLIEGRDPPIDLAPFRPGRG